jgi:hypothetical protein
MNNPHDYARGVLYRYFTFVFDTELCPGTPGTEWAFLTLDYLIWQSTLFPVPFLVDHFKNCSVARIVITNFKPHCQSLLMYCQESDLAISSSPVTKTMYIFCKGVLLFVWKKEITSSQWWAAIIENLSITAMR